MGGCALTAHTVVNVDVDEETSVQINSAKKIHSLRCAVAEEKNCSPHQVEIMGINGSNQRRLSHSDPLHKWVMGKNEIKINITPNRESFFTASLDNTAKQHDAKTGNCIATYSHPAHVNALCLSKCGCYVYTACEDGVCRKFDDRDASVVRSYSAKSCALVHVALSPGGDAVYTCTRSNVAQKFDEVTGQLLCVFFEHISGNPTLALSSCGTYIYKTTANHVARKYNWQTGEVLVTYSADECSVLGIILGKDEDNTTHVYVACSDGTVKQYGENGICLRSYPVHQDRVTWIATR